MVTCSSSSSHLQKYLLHTVNQSVADPCGNGHGYTTSLFPSPYSVSTFASTIFGKKPTMSSSPTLSCTSFWPLVKLKNIEAIPILETTFIASLGMSFFGPQAAGNKISFQLNCIRLQSRDDGFCGSELETEEGDDEENRKSKQQRRGRNPTRQKSLDDTPKLLLAGAVSTVISRTFVAPLERLKLEYIVRGAKDNWYKTIHFIWSSEGFTGFWKGNALNLFRMVPFKSINFVTYDMYCNWLLQIPGKEEIINSDRLAAGAVSGIVATMICLPMDTIRTRLVAPGGETLGGVVGCFQHMVRTEGFLSLYKGLSPTLLSMAPAGAVFYGVYDILKAAYLSSPKGQKRLRWLNQDKRERIETLKAEISSKEEEVRDNSKQMELGPVRTLVYGAIAGACAEIVTYPLEVVRRHLQLQETAKLGLVATFNFIVKRDGAGALYAGVFPSTVQVLPSAALSYLIYEFMKVVLKIS
ncbi:hypothetical protein SUGI_0837910 [Cryptomeria japonica]|nr:hypothetical protein SUGI_0837910 [Cryptomeria japonica]